MAAYAEQSGYVVENVIAEGNFYSFLSLANFVTFRSNVARLGEFGFSLGTRFVSATSKGLFFNTVEKNFASKNHDGINANNVSYGEYIQNPVYGIITNNISDNFILSNFTGIYITGSGGTHVAHNTVIDHVYGYDYDPILPVDPAEKRLYIGYTLAEFKRNNAYQNEFGMVLAADSSRTRLKIRRVMIFSMPMAPARSAYSGEQQIITTIKTEQNTYLLCA